MKKAEDQAEAEGDRRSPAGARLSDSLFPRPGGRDRCSRDGAASSAGTRGVIRSRPAAGAEVERRTVRGPAGVEGEGAVDKRVSPHFLHFLAAEQG